MRTRPIKALLSLLGLMAVTACGGTIVSETFDSVGTSLATPSPESSPSAAAEEAGTLTMVDIGGPVDGPGITVSDAIAAANGTPAIVNGILLKDLDGVIWLCDELADTSPPSCGEPRLRVLEYPEGGAEWDPETGELVGLQEEGGVFWIEGSRPYGIVEP